MNSYVVIDDERPDSTAATLRDTLETYGTSTVVCLSDFLHMAGWTFRPEVGLLEQEAASGKKYFLQDAVVCNRIIQVSKATITKMDQGFGVLNARLVLAAYNSTLKQAAIVMGELDPFPAGHVLPLNLQWRTFSKYADGIATPRFVYGFGSEEIDISSFQEPIWKSIFDLYNWQYTGDGVRPELQKFVVDKPTGIPVMTYFVGQAHSTFPLRDGDELSTSAEIRLEGCAQLLRNAFAWFMGEGLFYVDQEAVVFAAFSPSMKTSASDSAFQSVVKSGISSAFKEARVANTWLEFEVGRN